jgi:hypothetical protein
LPDSSLLATNLPAGAPPANATFFCEPASNLCYSYLTRPATWVRSRDACRALGGDLAKWDAPDKQLAAEVGGLGCMRAACWQS